MSTCIFCDIINQKHETDILYEDEEIIAFRDIKPATKFHILIVPKVHIRDANSLKPNQKHILEKLIHVGKKLVEDNGLNNEDTVSGFHWPPFNSVRHLHLHYINPSSEMNFLSRIIFKPNTYWFSSTDYVFAKLEKEEKSMKLQNENQFSDLETENSTSHL